MVKSMYKARQKIHMSNFIAELEAIVKELSQDKAQVEVELPKVDGKSPNIDAITSVLLLKGYSVSGELDKEDGKPIAIFRRKKNINQ